MTEQQDKPKPPVWTWAFIGACVAIPVVSLGGAIPGAIGAGGAGLCYGLARDGRGSEGRRALLCGLTTLAAWAAFGVLIWIVTGDDEVRTSVRKTHAGTRTVRTTVRNGQVVSRVESYEASRKDADELSESKRREIYADAVKRRVDIEKKKRQIKERVAAGRSVGVLREQLSMLEEMHEKHLRFVASWNKLTPLELDDIIAEGDEEGWPGN